MKGRILRGDSAPDMEICRWRRREQILMALDAYRRAGVALTGGMLLTPFKSVTAVIGVTNYAPRWTCK